MAIHKLSQDYIDMFIKLHKEGRTASEMARRFDMSPSRIRKAIQKNLGTPVVRKKHERNFI